MREGQLFLVAHGGNHPLVSNATAAGRARNRRVEIVIYPERTAAAGG
jgi:outer membrane protein OmpA-like peptidoglycan-associated protein